MGGDKRFENYPQSNQQNTLPKNSPNQKFDMT